MGRKKTSGKQGAGFIETRFVRKICPSCKGGDGINKEIYSTREDALDAAEYIKNERGIKLKVYQCGAGNGWHLTKDTDDSGTNGSSAAISQNDGFPRYSAYNSKVAWEFVEDGRAYGESATTEIRSKNLRRTPDYKSIKRIEGGSDNVSLSGVIAEMIPNASIEKIFNINLDNPISASLAKVFLDEEHRQITVHVKIPGGVNAGDKNAGSVSVKSYTALVKKTLLQKQKIKKGDSVNFSAVIKSINNKNVWHCVDITRTAEKQGAPPRGSL